MSPLDHGRFHVFVWSKRNLLLRAIALSIMVYLQGANILFAQTYQETLNFIFNGEKAWSATKFQTIMFNRLSNYDQENCTVQIESAPYTRKGTVSLGAITRWNWQATSDGTLRFGILRLESEGNIFDGVYFSQGVVRNGCGKNCSFITPSDFDSSRLTSAFQHLWNNYCKPGTPSSAF